MTDHLPDCPIPALGGIKEGPCFVCEALRACEQRVRDEFLLTEVNEQTHAMYRKGLDAARDAVAALPRWGNGPSDRDDALAAIDALRGES